MSTQEYRDRIKLVVEHFHYCSAHWLRSEHVKELFRGKTVREGWVEVFDVTGHDRPKRCYGWSYGEPKEFITILELPPVTDAQSAFKVGVAHQIRKARK